MRDFIGEGKMRDRDPGSEAVVSGSLLRSGRRRLLCLALAVVLLVTASCCRKFYRKSADEEVGTVLAEKDKYPAWQIEQFHIYPDPRSRFADPTNPDRPPMPPDDPGARNLSPNPQKPPHKAGVAYVEGTAYLELLTAWDAENRANLSQPAAQPEVRAVGYGAEQQGQKAYLISMEQAAHLGLINSREFQNRREDLYFLALPVTLERFAFAAQWFATESAVRELFGREAPDGPANRWVARTNTGFTKLFPTGALLLLQWANQTVVNLTGDLKHTISESTLSLDLLQPLLRGGGKAVTLEPLTQVERNLLYGVRDYARFRKVFFVSIAGGGELGLGATQVIGRDALSTTPGFQVPTQGYLPILLIGAQMANERKNVGELTKLLDRFRDFREGGVVQQLQVGQVEQQLRGSENTYLQTQLNYRDALDRFKLQLGLPPEVGVQLAGTELQQLSRQFQRYEATIQQFEDARAAVVAQEATEEGIGALASALALNPLFAHPAAVAGAARLRPTEFAPGVFASQLRGRINRSLTESAVVEGTNFRARVLRSLPFWRELTDDDLPKQLLQRYEERRNLLFLRTQLETQEKKLSEKDQQRLDDVEFEIDVGELEQLLREYEKRPWLKVEAPEKRLRIHAEAFIRVDTEFFGLLARARQERLDQLTRTWPELPALQVEGVDLLRVDLPEALAAGAQTALTYRLDLMNARAQLVDAWRLIAVTANALLGVINVRYHLDLFTPFGEAQPANFGGSRFRHQLFLNGELPLVRKLERNEYRAALINYQRQRRELMAAEDQALVGVREEIRQLRVLAENYRIQKRLVELAYLQVEGSEEEFRAPPASRQLDVAVSAAALTRQRLDAQSSLLRAQNQLYMIWINYLTTRLLLYRDLELMPLDLRGVWIDELTNLSATPDNHPPTEQLPAPRSLPDVGPSQP